MQAKMHVPAIPGAFEAMEPAGVVAEAVEDSNFVGEQNWTLWPFFDYSRFGSPPLRMDQLIVQKI